MIEIIFQIVFVLSLGGILFIFVRKLPALNSLPHNGAIEIRKHYIISDIENRIKRIIVSFEKQILLHKFLSWIKIMILRTETKIDKLLHDIRKKQTKPVNKQPK